MARETLGPAQRSLLLQRRNSWLLLRRAESLLALGEDRRAREAAIAAQLTAPADPRLFDAIGHALSRAGDQAAALAAYDRAVALAPAETHFRFNRATIRRFVGDLAGAEADYDAVISCRRDDYEAYLNRSELRTQTPARNHVAALEAVLTGRPDWRGEVALRYALAKEYEDLGEYARSFAELAQAAGLKRAHLSYDVERDVATVEWIIAAYPQVTALPAAADSSSARPIFIVGLPRSGSTVIERILACHPRVEIGGELPHFTQALVAAAGGQASREALIRRSARLDFGALGQDYLRRVHARGLEARCFTDKMPLNYLYCGLIRRALPGARIVHVRRHPMAACYAMYKRLFQDGYPFSYDLDDLGHYYLAYRRLMCHWRRTLPGAIHELRYEEFITDPLGATRRLLQFCGLAWHDACVDFHTHAAPTTTASAAQVRRPLYDTSVVQWRHYRAQLSTLEARLREAGIEND